MYCTFSIGFFFIVKTHRTKAYMYLPTKGTASMTINVTFTKWSLFLTKPGSITAKFRKMLHKSSNAL